jgi:hypothetical protein
MRRFAILPLVLSLTVAVAGQGALAQVVAGRSGDGGAEWVISETRSPVDYSPQVSATVASSPSPGNWGMSFSLHCRQGRTEALFVIPDFARYPSGASFPVEYFTISPEALKSRSVERRWIERRGVEKGWDELSSSVDAALTGDAVGFLKSLPDGGILSVRVRDRNAVTHDAEFHLKDFGPVREKLAAACAWPPR